MALAWRHLNFFQHVAWIGQRAPGPVRPVRRPGSGFTLLFEALVMSMVGAMPVKTLVGRSGFAAFVVVALYIDSLQAVELYRHPALLWGICPFLVYWYGRLVLLAHRGEMDDDPVNFAVHDRASYATALLLFAVWWLAI